MNAHHLPRAERMADGLYAPLLPADVSETVRRNRTFADLIADLGAEHDAHVARVEDFGRRVDEFGARLDALGGEIDG